MLVNSGKGSPRSYSSPSLKKLTFDQIELFLDEHASHGDQGAKDLLRVLLSENLQTERNYRPSLRLVPDGSQAQSLRQGSSPVDLAAVAQQNDGQNDRKAFLTKVKIIFTNGQ
jgi:hypothetical protein